MRPEHSLRRRFTRRSTTQGSLPHGLRVLFAVISLAILLSHVLISVPAGIAQEVAEDDPVATRKYSVALGFQKQRLYPQAAERWRQFLKTYPNGKRVPNAQHHLAVCLVHQQMFPEAVTLFREILAKHPTFPSNDSAQFNLGLALYNIALTTEKPADFQLATGAFKVVPAKYAKSVMVPTALYYQAECLGLAGDKEGSLPIYKSILTSHAKSNIVPAAYQALSETLGELNRDDEATASLKEFLAKHPQDPAFNESQLRLGLSLMKQQKFAEAHGLFAKVAAIKDFELADFSLIKQSESMYGQQNLPQAAALYESVASRFPMSSYIGTAFVSAGKCRFQADQFPNAQRDFTEVINRKLPEAAEASYWLGRTLIQSNKANEAVPALDKAIAAFASDTVYLPLFKFARVDAISRLPNRRKESVGLFAAFAAEHPDSEKAAMATYLAATGALAEEDHATAQKYCEGFLANAKFANDELVPEVHFVAGETYLRTTPPQPAKAEASYRKFIAAAPDHNNFARAQLGVAASLYAQQKYDETIQHLAKVAASFKEPIHIAESHLLVGRSHLEAKRHPDAIKALQLSIGANSKWERIDEAYFVLAVNFQAVGQLDPAVAEFNRVVAIPASAYRDQAIYQTGEIYRQQKKHPQAIAAYAKLVAELPKSELAPTAIYSTGIVHYEAGEYATAVAELGKLLSAYANSPSAGDAKYLRGMSHLGLVQYQPAAADLKAFLATALEAPTPEQTERRLDARFAIGQCEAGLKQYDAAIASMTKLLAENAKYKKAADVLYELAFVYTDAEKEKEAADTFQKLVATSPTHERAGECWYRIGEFHQNSDRTADAVAAYAAGLKVAKLPAIREKTLYKLATVQFSSDKFAEAVTSLQAQLKDHADGELKFAATYLLGESLYKQGSYAPALAELRKVVDSKEPAAVEFHAQALYRAGLSATVLKDWASVQVHLARLVAEHVKFEQVNEARYGLGVAYQSQQKFDMAISIFQTVTEAAPDTETAAKSWFMMGQCRFAEKKYAEAIDFFSEVAFGFQHDEWQPLSLFEAGRCYVQLKDYKAATSILTTLTKDFPKHDRAKDAVTILQQIANK